MTTYLLDLNYTLIGNSRHGDRRPMLTRIREEQPRAWLVDLLRDQHVILVTARPQRWREATLDHLRNVTGWEPQAAYFNTHDEPPPAAKERVLITHILPHHPEAAATLLALESNPATRAMYARYAVRALPVPKEGEWTDLPLPLTTT